MSGAGRAIGSLDRRLVDRSARLPSTVVDRTLLALTRSANHSALWIAVAAGLAAAGGSYRRGAIRGVIAVGGASALANGVGKPLFPRRRPPDESVPFVRRLIRPPVSSSFPSGHSASAAAFVTGVALESPRAGAVLAPVAAAVCYSRVHVGVHWPSDVIVGAALGASVAYATRHWWEPGAEPEAAVGPTDSIRGLPGGAGLLLVANPAAGSADELGPEQLRAALPAAQVVTLDLDRDVDDQIADALATEVPQALGVCGGDGTVLAVARAAIRHNLPLAVYPGGTLNHFARDAAVADPAATTRAVVTGAVTSVSTATVTVDGGSPAHFLNTASLGGYPDVVRLRERWTGRYGKWPAAAIALFRVLARAEPVQVRIDGTDLAIWMLFVGNGRYAPDSVPTARIDLSSGTLDVRYLRADTRFSRLRLLGAAVSGTLSRSPTFVRCTPDSLAVDVRGNSLLLATDGEVALRGRSFRFATGARPLTVYREPGID